MSGTDGNLCREYRRTIATYVCRAKNKKTLAERIMIVLVESGILYLLFFVSKIVAVSSSTI